MKSSFVKPQRQSRIGRLLKAVVIDDDPAESFPDGHDQHIELNVICTWDAAQHILARDADVGGGDLICVDVDMAEDDELKRAAEREGQRALLPVGPMIALPFIGRRPIMSCVIYTGRSKSELLRRHPYFLIPMGLIIARTNGLSPGECAWHSKYLSTELKTYHLDARINEMLDRCPSDTSSALGSALRDYRARLLALARKGLVSVANRTVIKTQLSKIEARVQAGEDLRLNDDICLALVGKTWADCIALRSVFADLNWKEEHIKENWIAQVVRLIEAIPENNVERALRVIEVQDESDAKDDERRPSADEVVKTEFGGEIELEEQTEILRLVVLFANVYAKKFGLNRTQLYQRLGDNLTQNTYFNWFGDRGTKSVTREGLLRLRPFREVEDKFQRCILDAGSWDDLSAEDKAAIQAYQAELKQTFKLR